MINIKDKYLVITRDGMLKVKDKKNIKYVI